MTGVSRRTHCFWDPLAAATVEGTVQIGCGAASPAGRHFCRGAAGNDPSALVARAGA